MKTMDIVQYSVNSLTHRQMRSWLTILGIVVGIAAVVSLITIGLGFSEEVNKQLGALGGRTIFVSPTASSSSSFGSGMTPSSGKLYQADYERLKKIPEIEDIARIIIGRVNIKFRDKEISSSVTGIEPGVFEKTTAIDIENGRFLVPSDRNVVVIGNTVSEKAFGQNYKVGVNSYLEMNGQKFRVIGIMRKSGNSFGGGRVDSGIFVPFDQARELFKDTYSNNELSAMAVLIKEGTDSDEVTEKMNAALDASRKVKPDERDYSVVNPKTIQAAINQVLGLITAFLGVIAGISLVVGALAITSAMFTSVIERTKEIGVLKSVGATGDDILKLFVFEAGLIGLIGGAIGVVIGLLIVYIGSLFGLPAYFNAWVAAFGLLFAFFIGLLSGYFPAKNAAALSPVDALKYE